MKYLLFILAFLMCVKSFSQRDTADINAINAVFKAYTDAIQKGQGREALKYISQKTIDYYDSLIFHALYSGEKELNKINILTRTAILRMRHTKPVAYWDTMSARELMVQMWTSSPQDRVSIQVSVSDCKIDPLTAICILELNGEPTDMRSNFNKEKDGWKVDITSINKTGLEEMQKEIKNLNLSETDYIILMLENLENVRVDKEKLYVPLKKR